MCKASKCLAALFIFCACKDLQVATFDYEHQAKWYDQYQQCRMNRQSPIELNSQEAEISYDIPPLHFEHYSTPYATPARIENNGHTANVQLPKPASYNATQWQIYDLQSPHITGGPLATATDAYIMESLHFHWGSKDAHGSEHVIDSERYSMEMHLLHRNSKYRSVEEAREHEDGLAVLAVLYTVKFTLLEDFAGLNVIINALEPIAEYQRSGDVQNVTLAHLLGDLERAEFYTYAGSLTTPPCSQAVTWVVFSHPIAITHRQMQRFHQLADGHGGVLENNYRSLQAKGRRKVYLRNKRKVLESGVQSPLYWELLEKLKQQNGAATTTVAIQ